MWYHSTSRFFLGAYLVYSPDKTCRGIVFNHDTAESWCNAMNMAAELRDLAASLKRITGGTNGDE